MWKIPIILCIPKARITIQMALKELTQYFAPHTLGHFKIKSELIYYLESKILIII